MNNELETSETTQSLLDSTGLKPASERRPTYRALKDKKYRDLIRNRHLSANAQIKWKDTLLAKIKHLRNTDTASHLETVKKIATFQMYYLCEEYGEFNDAGEWVQDSPSAKLEYLLPLVQPLVDGAKLIILRTDIAYQTVAEDKDSTVASELANMCQELADSDVRRCFTEDKRIREILNILLAGTSYRQPFWGVDSANPVYAEIPSYSNENIEIPGIKNCGNEQCGAVLNPNEEKCPKCGSVEIIQGESIISKNYGPTMQKVEVSENQLHFPNPLAVKKDVSAHSLDTTSFICETDVLFNREAEHIYKQLFADTNATMSQGSIMISRLEREQVKSGLDYDEEKAAAVETNHYKQTERQRYWLALWRYASDVNTEENWYYTKADGLIWCEKDEDVPMNAEKIQVGRFWGDVFPRGMFVCVVGDEIVEINHEKASDRWIQITFGIKPSNSGGTGLQRLRFLADMANDLLSLNMSVLHEDAHPQTFIDERIISHLAQQGQYNIVKNLQDGTILSEAVFRLQGSSSHPATNVMHDKIQAAAQFTAGTFSPNGGGSPNVQAMGTATGIAAMEAETTGRFLEAILMIKVADIRLRYAFLKNRQKFSTPHQRRELEERFGKRVTDLFFKTANLERAVRIEAVKGTDQPKSQALNIASMNAYAQAASQLANHPQAVELMQGFAETINIPKAVGIGQSDREEAKRRIGIIRGMCKEYRSGLFAEQAEITEKAMGIMAEVIKTCEQESFPAIIPTNETEMLDMQDQIEPPVSSIIMMQNHQAFMDEYRDFNYIEAAKLNNVVLQTVIQMMWNLHFERDSIKQKELMRIEGEKQLVIEKMKADFAKSQQPPSPSPEEIQLQQEAAKKAEDDALETQILTEAASRQADEEAKYRQFDREETGKDADLKRETLKAEHLHNLKEESEEKSEHKTPKKGQGKRDDYEYQA